MKVYIQVPVVRYATFSFDCPEGKDPKEFFETNKPDLELECSDLEGDVQGGDERWSEKEFFDSDPR